MFYIQLLKTNIILKRDKSSKRNYYFRKLSRIVSGETYSIPDSDIAIFAYCDKLSSEPLGAVTFRIAGDDEMANVLSFEFVLQQYQGHGIGKVLLMEALKIMAKKNQKKVTLEAAFHAVSFYEKMGFQIVGDAKDILGPGSHLFNRMFTMEREHTGV